MPIIDVCHPNEILNNQWTEIDSFSDPDDLENHVQHPSFVTSVGLCVRVTDESTQQVIYSGIYAEHDCVSVDADSNMMQCAAQRVPVGRVSCYDLFEMWSKTNYYTAMAGILLETLSPVEVVEIYIYECKRMMDDGGIFSAILSDTIYSVENKLNGDEMREKIRRIRQLITNDRPTTLLDRITARLAVAVVSLAHACMVTIKEYDADTYDDEIVDCVDHLSYCAKLYTEDDPEFNSDEMLCGRLRSCVPFLRIALGVVR